MTLTVVKRSTTTNVDAVSLGLAPLTEADIAEQTDSGSFSRGRGYVRSHHIFRAVRRENTLRARCHGSSGGPYLVEATLAKAGQTKKKNPIAFACDCPRGGLCKHIVAMLLTWIHEPESFAVRPPVAEMLAKKSREELVGLIEMLLRENPDLEELLDLPVLTAGTLGDDPVDEAAIRRQIAVAMRDKNGYGRGGWDDDGTYAASRIAGKLQRLIELADAYVEAGDWRNALRVSATFVEEFAPQYISFYDENSDLSSLLFMADENLADCLDAQVGLLDEERLSAEERNRLIDAILTIWRTDLEAGSLDISDNGPEAIARCATFEEQRRVGDWLREFMLSTSAYEKWHKQAAIGFLSILAGDAGLSDEELLTEYRNAELWEDAAALLLESNRVDDAIALARRHLTATTMLIPFANQLIASGDPQRIEQAIALVDDRLWEHEGENIRDDAVLREWLEKRYAEHGRPEKALELARGRFNATPNKATYDAVKATALLADQPGDPWPALRKEMIAALRKHGEWYALIDIFLEDGEIGEALKALQKSQKSNRSAWSYGWGVSPDHYASRVAAAAEFEFPDESIRIYRELADRLIAARGRPSYQYAAGYLARVWRVLETHGRGEEWPPLIGELRERNKSLRALREELDALGLR